MPPVNGSADLVVQDLATYPNPDGGVLVEAVFQNQGLVSTQNGFYTDLYVNHLPIGPGDYTGSLTFWMNDPIAAGATVTLTTALQNLSGMTGLNAAALSPASETTFTLYAQTDSTGSVTEEDNTNNIYSLGTEVCLASADAYEGDDTTATATLIAEDQMQNHNFDSMSDEDWFKFEAQAGITYTLRTLNLGMSADTYLYLYDTDGATLIASNDDYGGSLASQIEWQAPADGTYYVLVRHWNPNVNGCGTGYAFLIGDLKVFLPVMIR